MSTEILVTLIPSVLTLIGVWIQNSYHNKSVSELIEYRITKLEEKQDQHNNVITKVESRVITEQEMEKRISRLENKVGG